MKTTIIIKTISLTLLVALCTMGCKHKSIDDIVLTDTIPANDTETITPSVVDSNVLKLIADVRNFPQVTGIKAKYKESRGYLKYIYGDKPRILNTEMIALDNAYFNRFVELAYYDLADGTGWLSPTYDSIKTLYKEFPKKYPNINNSLWNEIAQAFKDYDNMCSYKKKVEGYQPKPEKVTEEWNAEDCKKLISNNPRRKVTSVANTSPIYNTLTDYWVRQKMRTANYRFISQLVTLSVSKYKNDPCNEEWKERRKGVSLQIKNYESLYHASKEANDLLGKLPTCKPND